MVFEVLSEAAMPPFHLCFEESNVAYFEPTTGIIGGALMVLQRHGYVSVGDIHLNLKKLGCLRLRELEICNMGKPVVEVQVRAVAAVSEGCAVFLGNEQGFRDVRRSERWDGDHDVHARHS